MDSTSAGILGPHAVRGATEDASASGKISTRAGGAHRGTGRARRPAGPRDARLWLQANACLRVSEGIADHPEGRPAVPVAAEGARPGPGWPRQVVWG
jgi:hypothetical protein